MTHIVRTILVVLSVATLYMSLAPEVSAQATCSLATVAGSWQRPSPERSSFLPHLVPFQQQPW